MCFAKKSRTQTLKNTFMGGPLPPGFYICCYLADHDPFGECIYLQQTITSLFAISPVGNIDFYDRGHFYIHGHGPKGSEGCIVVEAPSERHRLNAAVRDASDGVVLRVVEPGKLLPPRENLAAHTPSARERTIARAAP
jgi:hypothetical protein